MTYLVIELLRFDLKGINRVRCVNCEVSFANPEHLEILKKGVDIWNEHRKNHPGIRPNFIQANLSGANLSGVFLGGTDLSRTDLSGADLQESGLFSSDIRGADLGRVKLVETVFGNTNLKDAIGLETCILRGPSIIDHRIILKSGMLPISFLRGCGLPDELIDYYPSLLCRAIDYYSSDDKDFTNLLHARL